MPDTNGSQFAISSLNTNNPPNEPKIASFNNNQSVVVWYKANNAGYYQSYFQLVDGDGQKIGSETLIGYQGNIANQMYPNVAVLTNNTFLVTWSNQGNGNPTIFAQIFDSQGNQVTSPFQFQGGYWSQPLALPNGNVVVTWETIGASSADVYARIVDNSGNFITSTFKVNPTSDPNNFQRFPTIALLDNGQFIITWVNYRAGDSVSGIYGQIFNSDGTKQGASFKINTNTFVAPNEHTHPSITKLSNGNLVIFWSSNNTQNVYQILSPTGAKIGNEQFFEADNFGSGHCVRSIGNGFVYLWSSYTDSTWLDCYGQFFANNGSSVGNRFMVNQNSSYNQNQPYVTVTHNGDLVTIWVDDQRDVDNTPIGYSVQGQRFYGALTATNTNQTISYTEDDLAVSLNSISVRSPIDTLTASLKLSDVTAGRLTTATANNVTSTYTAATGTWQASGAKADVNTLLANVQFIPTANYNGNFSITLNIGDGFSTPINGTISAVGMPVNDIPVLVNNKLTISQGQTLVLTSSNLSATDVDNAANTLTFTVSNVQNGRFELIGNPGIAITTFIQQQISDGQVQFVHNGGSVAPAYIITVSDGSLTTAPVAATITYNAAPVLVNNQLTINQGQTLVLTSTNLSVNDADNTSGSLTFTVSNVQHGRFELLSNPGVVITSFTQQQITNGQIRFVQDNSTTKPVYQVSVSDGIVATTPESASVLFNMAPVLVNNQVVINEGQTLVLTTDNLSATDGDNVSSFLTFIISSVTHGRFEFTTNPGTSITSFTQQQIINGQVQFVHDGSEVAPTYKVSVSDGSASTPVVNAQISFTNINDRPVLVNNQLSISSGQTLILSSSNLSATDTDNISNTLVFTVSSVQHGQFELVANPGIAVTNFTQQQVATGQVQFIHDGSNQAPAYLINVSDGALETTAVAASIQFTIAPIAAPVAVTPNGEPATQSPSVSPMGITPMSSNPLGNTPSANSPQGETTPQVKVSSAASLSAGWISPATWLISSTQQAMRTLLSAEATIASNDEASYQAGSDTQHDIGYSRVYSVNSMMNNLPNQLMLLKVGIHWGQQAWQWLTQSSPKSSVQTSFAVESNKLMQEVNQLKVTLAQAERYQAALYVKNADVAEQYDLALETHVETLHVIAQHGKADSVTLDTLKADVAYLLNALKAEYKAHTASSQATASQISFFQPAMSSTKQANFAEISFATTNSNVVAADEAQVRCLLSK